MTTGEGVRSCKTLRGVATEVKSPHQDTRRSLQADFQRATMSDDGEEYSHGGRTHPYSDPAAKEHMLSLTSIVSAPVDSDPTKKGWRGSPRRFLERVKTRKSWGSSPKKEGGSPAKECVNPIGMVD